MKKIFLIGLLSSLLLVTGCSNYNEKTIKKDLNKNMNSMKGYHVNGNLEIYNGDNIYKYNVEISNYKDKYRVSLLNKTNNHEQIILKNEDGVYVLIHQSLQQNLL